MGKTKRTTARRSTPLSLPEALATKRAGSGRIMNESVSVAITTGTQTDTMQPSSTTMENGNVHLVGDSIQTLPNDTSMENTFINVPQLDGGPVAVSSVHSKLGFHVSNALKNKIISMHY
jgi:hypothetical protein